MPTKIGEDVFELPAPSGMRSFSLQQRILPVAGRIIGAIAQILGVAPDAVETLASMDITKVLPVAMPAIGEVFASMPTGELEAITRELLRDATIAPGGKVSLPLFGTGGADGFDGFMRGRTVDTWKLLWYALRVWYPDFFVLVGAFVARARPVNDSKASTTSPPNGPAGA